MYSIDQEIFYIRSITIRVLAPVKAVIPIQDATMGPFPAFGIALMTIMDEDGYTGEVPVYSSYDNILEASLVPLLLYNDGMPYHELYKQLYWSIRNEGFRGPASALLGQIDMALHDLAARRKGVPLHRYLGAGRSEMKVYGSGGGTNYSYKELEQEVAYFTGMGVDCYKMKVGKGFGTCMQEDAERVLFVRSLLGNKIRLAVDANQIWTTDEALRFIELTATAELAWLEEPIHSAALDQITQLCKRTDMKIAYGESERSAKVFPALVNAGVSHLQPVPGHLAGIKEWSAVKELAGRFSLEFSSGGYSLFTASLMAVAGEACQVEYLHAIMAGLETYFGTRPEWKNGRFYLPEVPGLAVRVNWQEAEQQDKVIHKKVWDKRNVREYRPVVSL
ncbi:enolase C-terminal domain-like protein [Chitinophaga qingshengii]|uniref:Mandelate racemase/muconate lactonizing enzyme C-terminal domain-containing protein n=1 Tax=Chitinophaga qingshengii TaxID=1569794 RepID=A0ABR7TJD8_9BACT|nr:enolase C-terminal domain-like protein [Chitinophaga qingshengii]MBC9930593.1 hypothetical protein [Chitinophaga qingshengii]